MGQIILQSQTTTKEKEGKFAEMHLRCSELSLELQTLHEELRRKHEELRRKEQAQAQSDEQWKDRWEYWCSLLHQERYGHRRSIAWPFPGGRGGGGGLHRTPCDPPFPAPSHSRSSPSGAYACTLPEA